MEAGRLMSSIFSPRLISLCFLIIQLYLPLILHLVFIEFQKATWTLTIWKLNCSLYLQSMTIFSSSWVNSAVSYSQLEALICRTTFVKCADDLLFFFTTALLILDEDNTTERHVNSLRRVLFHNTNVLSSPDKKCCVSNCQGNWNVCK